MSTTDLFVELIIIGIGGAIWLVLLILSVFGYNWLPVEKMFSAVALVPFLSIIYVLGIIIDRLADKIFMKLWEQTLFKKVYKDVEEKKYFEDKSLIYIHSGGLGDLLEYGRSRLRICRGWTINALCILVSVNIFIWTNVVNNWVRFKLSIALSVLIVFFAYGNWFSWRQLSLTNYTKIQKQSDFLRTIKP